MMRRKVVRQEMCVEPGCGNVLEVVGSDAETAKQAALHCGWGFAVVGAGLVFTCPGCMAGKPLSSDHAREVILRARMLAGDAVPVEAVQQMGAGAVVHYPEVGAGGRAGFTTVRNVDAMAIARLLHDGSILATGFQAALIWARAMDIVYASVGRVVSRYSDIGGGAGDADGEQARALVARERVDVAVQVLQRSELAMLDKTLRFDMSLTAAAQAVFGLVHRGKPQYLVAGRMALISACARLAVEYGLEKQVA